VSVRVFLAPFTQVAKFGGGFVPFLNDLALEASSR